MYIDIWNIKENIFNFASGQDIFNVVGRISNPDSVRRLSYSINGSAPRPVFFHSSNSSSLRLTNKGEFNIDTIKSSELNAKNSLSVVAELNDGQCHKREFTFPVCERRSSIHKFHLDLDSVKHPQEVGQFIDGRWRISTDDVGRRCLEISEKDAGYDRIILFSDRNLQEGYKIHARMRVNKWLSINKIVGLVFKWNPHLAGHGTALPTQWTTGLAYYYPEYGGLLLRYGIDVHHNAEGKKVGNHILAKAKVSKNRDLLNRLTKKLFKKDFFPQIALGQLYDFCLELSVDQYRFTVWPSHYKKPSPQIIYHNPPPLIEQGACGIICYYCSLQLYKFDIEPIR